MSSQYYCHHCARSVGLRDSDLICGICGSDFIEQLPHSMPPPIFPPAATILSRPPQFATSQSAGPGSSHRSRSVPRASRRSDTPPPPVQREQPRSNLLEPLLSLITGARTRSSDSTDEGSLPDSNDAARELVEELDIVRQFRIASGVESPPSPRPRPRVDELPEVFNSIAHLITGGQHNGIQLQIRVGGGPGERGRPTMVFGDYAIGDMDQILNNLINQFGDGAPVAGISEQQLAHIPMTKVAQQHVDNQTQCSTCFEDFILEEPVAELKCSHIFHADCVKPWLRSHNTCPVCRREVNPTEWTSNTAPTQEVSDPVPSSTPAGMVEHDELD